MHSFTVTSHASLTACEVALVVERRNSLNVLLLLYVESKFISLEFSKTAIFDFIFILSQESDGGTMHRTNPESLRSCPCFRVFRLNFAACYIAPCRDNCREASYPRTQPRGLGGS